MSMVAVFSQKYSPHRAPSNVPPARSAVLQFRAQRPQPDEPQDVFQGLTPGTGLHDFMLSRTIKRPHQNGVSKMDIMPLADKNDWFRIDNDYAEMIAQKKTLNQRYPEVVSATLPEGEAGAKELLETMADFLPQRYPEHFEREGRILKNRLTQDVYDLDHLQAPAIVVAGLLVQEDLILLHQDSEGKFRLSAGSLHFPSGWSLRKKLGKPLEAVHESVTLLNETIGAAIQRFLERLTSDRPFWRINFLSTESLRMTQLPDVPEEYDYRDDLKITPETVSHFSMRNEREVFTRLPKTGDILFSLKTYITAFKDLPPRVAQKLAEAIRAFPPAFITEYKGWSDTEKNTILTYLHQLANTNPT